MRLRFVTILSVLALAGCSSSSETQSFSVYFQQDSAGLDQQARESVANAADFAKSHQKLPVAVVGYAAPSDPKIDTDRLSGQRAEVVKQILTADGVSPERITATASGAIDPKPLPNLAVRRVDITVGQTD